MIIYEGKPCLPPQGFIAIVVSKFNRSITQRLLDGALGKLEQYGVRDQDIHVCWVPGAYEIPLLAARFAGQEDCLAVICLGAVIKGETSHDEHINRAVSLELAKLTLASETPVVFGVLTCQTVEQAEVRSGLRDQSRDKAIDPKAGNKGAEAAEVALEMIDLLTEVPEPKFSFPGMEEMFSGLMNGMGEQGSPFGQYEEDYYDEEEIVVIPDFSPKNLTKKKVVPKKGMRKKSGK
ncbi:MAG: 6,7-dimethyl-8-ribityllumazine synthase [Thermoguttaceae bacterium]